MCSKLPSTTLRSESTARRALHLALIRLEQYNIFFDLENENVYLLNIGKGPLFVGRNSSFPVKKLNGDFFWKI